MTTTTRTWMTVIVLTTSINIAGCAWFHKDVKPLSEEAKAEKAAKAAQAEESKQQKAKEAEAKKAEAKKQAEAKKAEAKEAKAAKAVKTKGKVEPKAESVLYTFNKGVFEFTVNKPLTRTYQVTMAAANNLKLSILEENMGEEQATIVARFDDVQKKTTVNLKAMDKNSTHVKIKVGVFGDWDKSKVFYETINRALANKLKK